jgi:hypothetical protein
MRSRADQPGQGATNAALQRGARDCRLFPGNLQEALSSSARIPRHFGRPSTSSAAHEAAASREDIRSSPALEIVK